MIAPFKQLLSALTWFALVTVISCNSKPPSSPTAETIQCDGLCMIVFKPDSAILAKKLATDKEFTFTETISDHDYYVDVLEQKLKGTDIRLIKTTARFITVETPSRKRNFEARAKEDGYPLGVILVKPDAEPKIEFGMLTDLDYRGLAEQYFGKTINLDSTSVMGNELPSS